MRLTDDGRDGIMDLAVATGASIVFFSAYSALVLREPFTRRHAVGMITGQRR